MKNTQTHPAARAYEGVGITPKQWHIEERRSLFLMTEPLNASHKWRKFIKPTAHPVAVHQAFDKRRQYYEHQGFDLRSVEGSHDEYLQVINPDSGIAVAEFKIVATPRPAHGFGKLGSRRE